MNQYVKTSLGVGIIIIMTMIIGFFSWSYYRDNLVEDLIEDAIVVRPQVKNALKFCTQEAKLCPDGVNYVGRTGANCEFAECPEVVGIVDKLVIDSLTPNETISSPVSVSGRARGGWFFEGSFPVEVYDSANKLLGSDAINFRPKSTDDTWMTTEFVDFQGEIKFTQPKTIDGYLLFKKDNPSDMRELDESFKLPVKFRE